MNRAAVLRVAGFYALLVVAVWAPYTLGSGMPHEHAFAWESEHASVLSGFVRGDQPTRALVTSFHHTAFLLGEVAGVGGSFVPYQIVFACLWWARGVLVFLILRRLLPGRQPFTAAVGGLAILHASDHAVSWVGVMAIYGAMVWTLACIYACVAALQAGSPRGRRIGAVAAAAFGAASLWTYEAPIPLLVAVPLLLAWRLGREPHRFMVLAPLAFVVAAYLIFSASWYLSRAGPVYQQDVLRDTWSVGELLAMC